MKTFRPLFLLLLTMYLSSCAQEIKILEATKTPFYTGTSGFSGWNFSITTKNLKPNSNIQYQYLLKDGKQLSLNIKDIKNGSVIKAFEDRRKRIPNVGEKEQPQVPDSDSGYLYYKTKTSKALKRIIIKKFVLIEEESKQLNQ